MKKIFIVLACICVDLSLFAVPAEIGRFPEKTGVFEKFEVVVKTESRPANPYDYSSFRVEGEFVSPSGRREKIDGFYTENRAVDKKEERGSFRIRYLPNEAGTWRFRVRVYEKGDEARRTKYRYFDCAGKKAGRGFIRLSPNDPLFLEFKNKEPFFGLGMNIKFSDDIFTQGKGFPAADFAENGVNLIRPVFGRQGPGTGSKNDLGNYAAGQKRAEIIDQIIETCRKNGIYIIFPLVSYGEFSKKAGGGWESSPYNIINDGLLKNPGGFFTDKVAIKAFKNRVRYITARWGYSPSVMAWELFDRPDLVEGYAPEKVKKWHEEIAETIGKYGGKNRLITTLFYNGNKGRGIWGMDKIDFTQACVYGMKNAGMVYGLSKIRIDDFSKPHIVSGVSPGPLYGRKKSGIEKRKEILHDALWAGAFSLSFGAPLIVYQGESGAFSRGQIKILSDFTKGINWARGNFFSLENRKVVFEKPKSREFRDVILYPSARKGGGVKNKFWVKSDGRVINSGYLTGFLFGKEHENKGEEFIFSTTNMSPSKMSVSFSGVSGENIFRAVVNNSQISEVAVSEKNLPGEKYSVSDGAWSGKAKISIDIPLPVGENEIKFSNTGRGWVLMDSIVFEKALSPKFAPVFVSGMQSNDSAYMWIKNNSEEKINGAYINLPGLDTGRYVIRVINPRSGETIKTWEEIDDNKMLRVNLPEFSRDIAVKVKEYGE